MDLNRGHFRGFIEAFSWIFGSAGQLLQEYGKDPFCVNPEYIDLIQNGPINIAGSDNEGEIRIIEYTGHPFFIGTLFVPQALSTEKNPHPIVTGFLQVIMKIDIAEKTSAGDAQS